MPRLEQTLSNVKEGAKITLYWDSFNGYDDEYDHSPYDYSIYVKFGSPFVNTDETSPTQRSDQQAEASNSFVGIVDDKSAFWVSADQYVSEFTDDNGEVIKLVKDYNIAWHAGKSYWKKDKLLNNHSIGIEISNPGHDYGYKAFKKKQIKCLIKISKLLIKKYNINKNKILGHSDIAPLRKIDPGEKFPWKLLNKKKNWFLAQC